MVQKSQLLLSFSLIDVTNKTDYLTETGSWNVNSHETVWIIFSHDSMLKGAGLHLPHKLAHNWLLWCSDSFLFVAFKLKYSRVHQKKIRRKHANISNGTDLTKSSCILTSRDGAGTGGVYNCGWTQKIKRCSWIDLYIWNCSKEIQP